MALEKLTLVPEQSGYKYNINHDVISIQLEGGLSRRRRDKANSASIIECEWVLQDFEYQYFMSFFHSAAKRGSSPFLIDLLLEQPYLEEQTCTFVEETLEVTNKGLAFFVKADLESVPAQDDNFADMVLLLFDPKGTRSFYFDLIEQIANYDLEI